jgi:hypothetical protein
MPTTWLVQETRNPSDTVLAIKRACEEQRLPFEFVPVTPFSTEIPSIAAKPPFVFYGYTTLILNAYRDKKLRNGVFFDPKSFTPSAYQANWGERLLNTFQFETMHNLAGHWRKYPDRQYFLKPDDDLKRFTGGVMDGREFLTWYDGFKDITDTSVRSDTTVAFCSPIHDITAEFRVVLVDGKGIAASAYRPRVDYYVPRDLIDFAEEVSAVWQPAPIYVLDIAYCGDNDEMRIVEANCFNGSNFYNANASNIVRAVSLYQEAAIDR